MSRKSVLILIPARFASSRYPGKPLVEIAGKSMVMRVLENASACQTSEIDFDAYIVTDDQRIEDHIKSFSDKVLRVDDDVNSGTLRIALAYERFFQNKKYDLIINVQGDEPLLKSGDLINLAEYHLRSPFEIATLVKKYAGFGEDFFDANKVKVVLNEESGRAHYFSRAPIPYKRDKESAGELEYWYHHIGVYSYQPKALIAFSRAQTSRLEELEKLEQLRALDLGMSIGVVKTTSTIIGVDHPADLKKVEEVICGGK